MAACAAPPPAVPNESCCCVGGGGERLAPVKETLDLHRYSAYHQRADKLAFRMHNVLTREECGALIRQAEDAAATPGGGGGFAETAQAHRLSRCWSSKDLSERLWNAIQSHVTGDIWGCALIGLSERFVLFKDGVDYECAEYFDEVYERPEDRAVSHVSVLIHLNDDYDGGRLTFMKRSRPGGFDVTLEPRTGTATILQHNILHQRVTKIERGHKYTLRADVMYISRQRTGSF